MINGGTTPNVKDRTLTHFLENDRVAVGVFYAEELEPVWCHFRTLSIQTPLCELLIGKLYIGATDVKHSIFDVFSGGCIGRSFESY